MKKTLYALFTMLVLLTVSSCDLGDDGPNFNFVPLEVISVDIPETFDLNETYSIEVTYIQPDGCTFYEGFDFDKPELTTRNVVVVGSQRTDQEVCTQEIREGSARFDFLVLYEETYLFRFWQGEDANGEQQYLEIEVPVN